MSSFLGVPVDAAYHLVSGLTGILTPALGGLAAVAAIVAFTMAVRLLLMPLSLRALRGQAAQARLAPQLVALRQRYGKQPERLQREMAALYKREGTSMFAGFAPLLLQWPFLSVMYLLFRSPTVGGTANTLLTHDLLGVPLGAHWLSGAGPLALAGAHGVVFVGLFALLATLCWLSARLGRLMTAQVTGATAGGPGLLVRALPYVTVVIAAFAPLAAGIYLLTTLAWSLAERMLCSRSKGWTALGTDHGSRGRRFPQERPSLTQSDPRRRRTASVE
ncbi:MAG TPA: membrane protein insertase YidC [Streptosporangiaceae bacterium]|nr:membrane protein insertase YidC [Streptosporangiaceae bacterium]